MDDVKWDADVILKMVSTVYGFGHAIALLFSLTPFWYQINQTNFLKQNVAFFSLQMLLWIVRKLSGFRKLFHHFHKLYRLTQSNEFEINVMQWFNVQVANMKKKTQFERNRNRLISFTSHKSRNLIFIFSFWMIIAQMIYSQWIDYWPIAYTQTHTNLYIYVTVVHHSISSRSSSNSSNTGDGNNDGKGNNELVNTLTNWTFIRFIDFLVAYISNGTPYISLYRRLSESGKSEEVEKEWTTKKTHRNVIQCHKITFSFIARIVVRRQFSYVLHSTKFLFARRSIPLRWIENHRNFIWTVWSSCCEPYDGCC